MPPSSPCRDTEDLPDALDGLGRALWWLREWEQAVVHRQRAYSGFRRLAEAALIYAAAWIALALVLLVGLRRTA